MQCPRLVNFNDKLHVMVEGFWLEHHSNGSIILESKYITLLGILAIRCLAHPRPDPYSLSGVCMCRTPGKPAPSLDKNLEIRLYPVPNTCRCTLKFHLCCSWTHKNFLELLNLPLSDRCMKHHLHCQQDSACNMQVLNLSIYRSVHSMSSHPAYNYAFYLAFSVQPFIASRHW